jgi:voltage-gated potassium channel Kch
MRRISRADRLRYRFDNLLSRGPIVLIGFLFLLSAGILVLVVAIMAASGQIPRDGDGKLLTVPGMAWTGLLATLDTGEIENVSTNSAGALAALLLTTFGGIFLTSILIGLLTTGISNRLDALRKGRSLVVEQGHTVILGWSPLIFTLLSELVLANQNQRRSAIAILADRDKVEMEDEIRDRLGYTAHTRIICRTGSPIDLGDLELVNPHAARAIIVPTPDVTDPDAHVIKTILAITNNPRRRPEPYHIVAELHDSRNLEVARLVAHAETQLVASDDMVARIIVQTCRQAGLSVVYTELLDFGGDEIYFQNEPTLTGRTFGESLAAYEDSAVIGMRFADGRVALNPPMSTIFADGDAVIAISQDDDTVRVSGIAAPPIDPSAIQERRVIERVPERTLILGWNNGGSKVVRELDNYVAPGSLVTVVAIGPGISEDILAGGRGLRNQTLDFQEADTTDREILDGLDITSYDHVITLSYVDSLETQAADARTLISLLHLRDILERAGDHTPIVSEMLDLRNRQIAQVTHADDFIVSNQLVSMMLAQVAENRELLAVFNDLFDADGSELYLKPAADYIQLHRPLSFYTVVEAAKQHGQCAIGYRIGAKAKEPGTQYGVRVNPRKSELITFAPEDRIIVVAQD